MSLSARRGGEEATSAWGVDRSGAPASSSTLFQAASISKPLAAVVTLRLVEEGRLALDDPVNDLLRRWRLPDPPGWSALVTVRHLLCHAGGLSLHGFPGYPGRVPLPTTVDILEGRPPANTPPLRVVGIPGLCARYSGGGYVLLGLLLEDVSGIPYSELARDLVLQPAGMDSALVAYPLPSELGPRAAHGFEGDEAVLSGGHVYPELSAGGLWCTPKDLVRFAAAIQRARDGAPDALLSRDLVAELLTEHVPGWGLGFMLEGTAPHRRFAPTGRNRGFIAILQAAADGDQTVAATASTTTAGPAIRDLVRAASALLGWPLDLPEPLDKLPAVLSIPGHYRIDGVRRFEVGLGETLRIERDAHGSPVELVVHQGGQDVRCPRIA